MLNCAIVGAGRSGSHLMMRPLKDLHREVRVVAICDRNLELAKTVARQHGIDHVYTDLSEALEAHTLDFVCVSTPHSAHFDVAKLSLLNNCSVIIEKPFTETLDQAHELIHLAQERGKSVVVVHNHKFYRGMVEGRKLLERCDVGRIINIHCNWISSVHNRMVRDPAHWVHREKGGIFKEVLPHALYGTYSLVGELQLIDVLLDTSNTLQHLPFRGATILLKNSENIPVSIRLSFDGDYLQGIKPKPTWIIQGSHDGIIINYGKSTPIPWNNSSIIKQIPQSIFGIIRSFFTAKKVLGAHNEVIRGFIDHIQNGSPSPVSVDEIMNTMEITDQVCSIIEEAKA